MLAVFVLLPLVLVACTASPPRPTVSAPPVPPLTAPAPPPEPVPAPVPPQPEPPRPPPSAPPTPQMQQQATRIAQGAAELLEAGNETQARTELQRVFAIDPANRLALNLQRQMTEDPVAALGRESFPYVVRAGDTLSKIAGRFLNDVYAFHILARYNNIKVPRQVGEGQTLRIPGKAPPPSSPKAPNEGEARPPPRPEPGPHAPPQPDPKPADPTSVVAERALAKGDAAAKAGNDEAALSAYQQAAALGHPDAAVKVRETSARLVEKYARAARGALAKQDLDGALRDWDRVLQVDPDHETAKIERERVKRLQEKVKKL